MIAGKLIFQSLTAVLLVGGVSATTYLINNDVIKKEEKANRTANYLIVSFNKSMSAKLTQDLWTESNSIKNL